MGPIWRGRRLFSGARQTGVLIMINQQYGRYMIYCVDYIVGKYTDQYTHPALFRQVIRPRKRFQPNAADTVKVHSREIRIVQVASTVAMPKSTEITARYAPPPLPCIVFIVIT